MPGLFPGSRTHLLVLLFPKTLFGFNPSCRSGPAEVVLPAGAFLTEGCETPV